MKFNFLFFMLIMATAMTSAVHAQYEMPDDIPSTSTQSDDMLEEALAAKEKTDTDCKCYCSDLCGLRKRREIDKPFVDKRLGICFCAVRDRINYERYQCHAVEKPTEPTCCSKNEQFAGAVL